MEKAHRQLLTKQNLSPNGHIQGMEKRAWQNPIMHIRLVKQTVLALLLNQKEATKSKKKKVTESKSPFCLRASKSKDSCLDSIHVL